MSRPAALLSARCHCLRITATAMTAAALKIRADSIFLLKEVKPYEFKDRSCSVYSYREECTIYLSDDYCCAGALYCICGFLLRNQGDCSDSVFCCVFYTV